MVVSPLHADIGVTGRELAIDFSPTCALRRMQQMQGAVPQTGGFGDLSYRKECRAWWPEEGSPPPEKQEFSRKQFFSDPSLWWENRRSQATPKHPDFKHKNSEVSAWLRKSAGVDSQLATWDGRRMKRTLGALSTSVEGQTAFAAHEGHFGVQMWRKLCDDGPVNDVVDAVNLLVQRGRHIPNNFFYRLLKRCIADKDLVLGRHIHALSVESGYEGDDFLATHLISLYAYHGRLEEAMRVFTKVSTPSAHTWATIIFAYARNGKGRQGIRLYRQMRESNVKPDNRTYSAVLKACASAGDLVAGKEVHAHILDSAEKPDVFVQTGLLDMYAKCGSLDDARGVFDRLPEKNMVTWNAMLAGYVQKGMGQKALNLYSRMQQEGLSQPDRVTFVCILQACASVGIGALRDGRKLHALVQERGLQDDVVLGGSLVNMYAKCGSLNDATDVFHRLSHKDVVTWNAMIAGYARKGMSQEALSLYSSMRQEGVSVPNSVTFVCLLQACAGAGALHQGKKLHAQIEERGLQDDVVLGCSLVNMYAKCGRLEDARRVFDRIPDKNMVTWNAMLAGYAQQEMGQEALSFYDTMQEDGTFSPDFVTFVSLLQSCASVGKECLHHGIRIHAQIKERGLQDDVVLGCSLVNMYAKCGSLEDASILFDRLPNRDVVTWNALLAGYADQGMVQEAFSLYNRMQKEALSRPDSITFACLLQACAIAAALPLGKQLHAQIEEQGMQADVVVGGALVNMYAKCGSMLDSQQVFDSLAERRVGVWGALIGGYSRHGDSKVVFELLDRMRLEGIQPSDIIFLSVLTVCSHVGLVDKGRQYFAVMQTDYGITPAVEHYTCMIDLLGRAGHLDEALRIAKTMPFPPDDAVWATLLGACRKWNNIEIGQQAFESAVRLDEKNAASYALMYNIYARSQMWEEAKEMQIMRVKCGARKEPGQSWWTDMAGVVHTFVVGDKLHPESLSVESRSN